MIALDTTATLLHVNARKEGPADDQVPALDVKLEAAMDADILAHFHGSLRGFLFNDDGAPRFPQMDAVKWKLGVRQVIVEIGGLRVHGDLRKFWFAPSMRGAFALFVGFTLTFRPSGTEASTLVELLGEQVKVKIIDDQLPLGTSAGDVIQAVDTAEKLLALRKLKDLAAEDGATKVTITHVESGKSVTLTDEQLKSAAKRGRRKRGDSAAEA